jgi:hypothetical protein
VRGTAQWLGRRGAIAAAWGGYLVAVLLALFLGLALGHSVLPLCLGTGVALGLLALAVCVYARQPSRDALQLGWSVLAPGAGVLAIGWLASVP